MSTKRVGQILREAREERRLTVRDVSKDTNIAIKFILALENEDYSQFPAETFAMGFLKTYSDYLKLDTAFIMNMYRGEKMEEAHAPLEELTKPTKPIVNSVKGDRIKVITIMFIIFFILFVIIIFGVFLDDSNNGSIESKTEPVEKKEKPVESEALIPKSISFSELAVPEGKYAPFIVTQEKGVRFSVGNKECRIFIKEVKESADGDVAVMGFNIFPDKYIHTFEVRENATSILSYEEPKLASLPKKVFVKAQVVTFRSAKLLFSLGQEENANTDSNISSGDVPIQLTLKFVKTSFAEFVIDGQKTEQGRIKKGTVKKLEAKDRIEIKVIDGSAVELEQNGQNKGALGRPGQTVKKVYYKVPDLYDSTKYQIKESGG